MNIYKKYFKLISLVVINLFFGVTVTQQIILDGDQQNSDIITKRYELIGELVSCVVSNTDPFHRGSIPGLPDGYSPCHDIIHLSSYTAYILD